jgi:hypothetical protein
VKTVDHWDGAEESIEIKDGGAPLAIYYVPGDPHALYRWKESSENRAHRGGSLNGRANRSHELYIVVKWRSTHIPCSKPVQVRFNGIDHVFPHEKLHFQVVPQTPSPKISHFAKSTQNDPDGPFSHPAISDKMFSRSTSSQGAVMNQSDAGNLSRVDRPLNAVALQYAVLCADCDVVSDSPHDICMVCGSRSLVNICRILGGKMPKNRAELLKQEPVKITREIVMHFPKPHRVRRRVSV